MSLILGKEIKKIEKAMMISMISSEDIAKICRTSSIFE